MASVRSIKTSLQKKAKPGKKTPCITTISKAKRKLGFQKHKVVSKPMLNKNLFAQRLKMAQERICSSDAAYIKKNACCVFAEEKWSSEKKGAGEFEARKTSPVPKTIKFKGKDAETRTQLIKIMYIFCITSNKK